MAAVRSARRRSNAGSYPSIGYGSTRSAMSRIVTASTPVVLDAQQLERALAVALADFGLLVAQRANLA